MTRSLKKSYACIGCDDIENKIGWPCNSCPRQKLNNPDMHSTVRSGVSGSQIHFTPHIEVIE